MPPAVQRQKHLLAAAEDLVAGRLRRIGTLVLLGTYKLLEIRDHSAQLMRRSQIVHFPSYRLEQREDQVAFKSTLDALAKALPIPLEAGMLKRVDYFFNKTAGCIGIRSCSRRSCSGFATRPSPSHTDPSSAGAGGP